MIFEIEKWALGQLCQIVIGPQFQNFPLKCCFLTWLRASKKFDSYPMKIEEEENVEPGPGWIVFIDFLKAKIEEKLK